MTKVSPPRVSLARVSSREVEELVDDDGCAPYMARSRSRFALAACEDCCDADEVEVELEVAVEEVVVLVLGELVALVAAPGLLSRLPLLRRRFGDLHTRSRVSA